jgi:hypothetical protein
MPDKVAEMAELMNTYLQSKGTLPPSLVIGDPADHAHYEYLIEKYGRDYNHVDW